MRKRKNRWSISNLLNSEGPPIFSHGVAPSAIKIQGGAAMQWGCCTGVFESKHSHLRSYDPPIISWILLTLKRSYSPVFGSTQRRTFRNILQWAWNLPGLRELAYHRITTAFLGKLKGVLHSQEDGTDIFLASSITWVCVSSRTSII